MIGVYDRYRAKEREKDVERERVRDIQRGELRNMRWNRYQPQHLVMVMMGYGVTWRKLINWMEPIIQIAGRQRCMHAYLFEAGAFAGVMAQPVFLNNYVYIYNPYHQRFEEKVSNKCLALIWLQKELGIDRNTIPPTEYFQQIYG